MTYPASVKRNESVPGENSSQFRDGDEISLLDLLIALVQSRALIFKITAGTTLAGIILCFILPTRYKATTSLLPPQQSNSSGAALLSQLGNLGSVASLAGGTGFSLKNPNDLQVSLLKSRIVEDAMVERFRLKAEYKVTHLSDARKMLEKVVEIDNGAKDGLIRISVTDGNAAKSAEMANAYVEEYKRRTAGLAVTEASQRRLFFEDQLEQAKSNLTNAEEQLKETEQKTGLIQLDSQARAEIELVAQLRAQVAAKEVQINAMRSFATDENPGLLVAEQELTGLRTQLTKLGADTSKDSIGTSVPNGKIQGQGLDYIRKLREAKYYETIFDLLARQFEIAKVDEARQGATIQVVDPAVVPDRRSSPQRLLIIVGAAALGLLGAIAWSIAKDSLRQISMNPVENERISKLQKLIS